MTLSSAAIAQLAARQLSSVNPDPVADQYLTWIMGKGDEAAAGSALTVAADSSKRPAAVLVRAEVLYPDYVGTSDGAAASPFLLIDVDLSEEDQDALIAAAPVGALIVRHEANVVVSTSLALPKKAFTVYGDASPYDGSAQLNVYSSAGGNYLPAAFAANAANTWQAIGLKLYIPAGHAAIGQSFSYRTFADDLVTLAGAAYLDAGLHAQGVIGPVTAGWNSVLFTAPAPLPVYNEATEPSSLYVALISAGASQVIPTRVPADINPILPVGAPGFYRLGHRGTVPGTVLGSMTREFGAGSYGDQYNTMPHVDLIAELI